MFFIKKILIIFGGNSPEHYISCKSCKSIVENIDKEKYEIKIVGIDFNNNWYEYHDDIKYIEDWKEKEIKRINNIINYLKEFDVVFPIIHGPNGEDGKLQGMFEIFSIKYVGCNSSASFCMMDKSISKLLFNSIDIKQVPYVIMDGNVNLEIEYPVIVKPSNGGSSIGINKASNDKELDSAIKVAKKYDNKIVIEKFINMRELEVAVLEYKDKLIISRPGEIKSAGEFYDYNSKYVNKKSFSIIPDNLPNNIVDKIRILSENIFRKLNLKGYSRIDYFYDDINNEIYINEVNTIPGFTEISMYPKLINDLGISYKDLISMLIESAL